MSKIDFLSFLVVQKFLNSLYNRVMELYSGLCVEMQSYETRVIMDSKFSSKKCMIYKIEILDKHSYKSGMVLRYGLGAWTCHPGGLGLSPAEEISSFLCNICQFLQFFYGLNNFEIQKWGIFILIHML